MSCADCSSNLPPDAPVEIVNRPALSAVAARIGTFASFRSALLDQLASTPELAALLTRAGDDFSITLIELWSLLADVLTFYQERAANEGYLRTATLRDSVLRLVRLIDYQLQPGLAATTLLAFTMEPGASVTIPVGLRVQSVPVGDASPQKYETTESILADARFNSLPVLPAPELVRPLSSGRLVEWFAPGADMLAFAATLAPGDRLAAFTSSAIEILTVASVIQAGDRIGVRWVIPPSNGSDFRQAATGLSTGSGLFKIGRTFRLFGCDAPATYLTMTQLSGTAQSLRALPTMTPPLQLDLSGFFVDGRYQGIKPGASCLIAAIGSDLKTTTTILASVLSASEGMAVRGPVSATATRLAAQAQSGPSGLPSIAVPASAPNLAPAAAPGNLTGTYEVLVTYFDGNTESTPTLMSPPVTVNGQNILFTPIPVSPDPNVTNRNIYGFKSGVSASFQLISQIDNQPGTQYTITADQPAWTSVLPAALSPLSIDPTLRLQPTPGSAPGNLTGTYAVMVTYFDGTVESNPSPVSPLATVNSQNLQVSSIPVSADSNVTKRNIYGFKYGVSSSFQLIGQIDNQPGTQFTITTDQNSWGVVLPVALSAVSIYELIGPQLRFQRLAFPPVLNSGELYLSGQRNGWDTIEVGRTIVKGVMQPGVTLGVNDLAPGRNVIVTDAGGASAVSAVVEGAELVGNQIDLSATTNDLQTIATLGINPGGQPITALASPPLDDPITLINSSLKLQVTIGRQPPQVISLAAGVTASVQEPLSNIATALQNAITGALPDVPEFKYATVTAQPESPAQPAFLVVVPGVPDAPMSFAPTPDDPDTVVALGLTAPDVRYLDGVLSAPLTSPAPASGFVEVTIDLWPPQTVQFQATTTFDDIAKSVSTTIKSQFHLPFSPVIKWLDTSKRILWLPPPAQFERPAFLRLSISPDGPVSLASASSVLLGNVANGSQGETVANEIMGDGDASKAFASFVLRKKPVTFLLGDGPHGARSSLKVAVNGVQWIEAPSLYGTNPSDQVFVTRVADDGSLTVQFGDGLTGARLPTGAANVIANYRQGVGLAGGVDAGTLTSLLDRPNGLKRVTNPIAADGGADPQKIEDARANAPATVRTFDRAVSLQDFQDVAIATGEVAKASATWVWSGFQKVIFLTVAASDGGKLSDDGLKALASALQTRRDPNHQLFLDNYVRVPIIVTASLTVDPRYPADAVRAAAFNALLDALSFDRLQFAQAIHLSAIYAVLQGVPGVAAVDIADLNFKNQDPAFRAAHGADGTKPLPHLFILGARPGSPPGPAVQPAELAWVEVPVEDLTLTVNDNSDA